MNHTRFPKEDHLPYSACRDNKVTKGDCVECFPLGACESIHVFVQWGEKALIITLKMLDTTIQNLVTQDLCIPDLQIKRKQNLFVVRVTAPDIYTCQKCRMSESCAVYSTECVRTS